MTYPPNADAARRLAARITADPQTWDPVLASHMCLDLAAENDTLRAAIEHHRTEHTRNGPAGADERLWSVLGPLPGCVRDGCDGRHWAKGMCHAHYNEASGGAA